MLRFLLCARALAAAAGPSDVYVVVPPRLEQSLRTLHVNALAATILTDWEDPASVGQSPPLRPPSSSA